MHSAKEDMGVVFLELNWEDTTDFVIPEDDLVRCVQFVHSARKKGSSVLIHCAQVRPIEMFVGFFNGGQSFAMHFLSQ